MNTVEPREQLPAVVEAVQRQGVRVTVISTIRTQPPITADELRRQADVFVELQDIAPQIMRNHVPREEGRGGAQVFENA